ncbi:hypothetical protein IAU60_004227 [Kwoniella sp. DSM 27419]
MDLHSLAEAALAASENVALLPAVPAVSQPLRGPPTDIPGRLFLSELVRPSPSSPLSDSHPRVAHIPQYQDNLRVHQDDRSQRSRQHCETAEIFPSIAGQVPDGVDPYERVSPPSSLQRLWHDALPLPGYPAYTLAPLRSKYTAMSHRDKSSLNPAISTGASRQLEWHEDRHLIGSKDPSGPAQPKADIESGPGSPPTPHRTSSPHALHLPATPQLSPQQPDPSRPTSPEPATSAGVDPGAAIQTPSRSADVEPNIHGPSLSCTTTSTHLRRSARTSMRQLVAEPSESDPGQPLSPPDTARRPDLEVDLAEQTQLSNTRLGSRERRKEQNAAAQKKLRCKKKQVEEQMAAELQESRDLASRLQDKLDKQEIMLRKLRDETRSLKRKLAQQERRA